MKQFNDKNFVLDNEIAQDLYHNHAAKMPIIDYHCHLIPEMVANDHRFKSITELWLGGIVLLVEQRFLVHNPLDVTDCKIALGLFIGD